MIEMIAPSCTIVTIDPALPVSKVPLIFTYVNAAIDITTINLSRGIKPNRLLIVKILVVFSKRLCPLNELL
jgi:hypothetical protein